MSAKTILDNIEIENKAAHEGLFKLCKNDESREGVEAILKIAQAFKGELPIDDIAKAIGAKPQTPPVTEPKKVEKELDPEVVKLLKERDDQLERVQKELAAEREVRLEKEAVAEVATIGLSGLTPSMLREVREKCSPETAKKFVDAMNGWSTQIAGGALFKEIGRTAAVDERTDFDSKIEAVAVEIRKAHPELTAEQAQLEASRTMGSEYLRHMNAAMTPKKW